MERWKKRLLLTAVCILPGLPLAAWEGEPTLQIKLPASAQPGADGIIQNQAVGGAPGFKAVGGARVALDGTRQVFFFSGSPECRLETTDAAAFAKWAKKIQMQNISGSCYVKVNGKTNVPPTPGTISLRVDARNRLLIYLPTKPGEFAEHFVVLHSREAVKFGKWMHVMFNFSLNRGRATMYIDGAFQTEIDDLNMPKLYLTSGTIGAGFNGQLADLQFHDAALNSEDLLPKTLSQAEKDELAALAQKALSAAGGNEFKTWVSATLAKSSRNDLTFTDWRNIRRDLRNAVQIGEAFARPNTIKDKAVTAYCVDPYGQEMLTPYLVPTEGTNTNRIRFTLAQNEFESFSFLVFAFRKIDQFNIKLSDFKSKDGGTIPAAAFDARLVKRWIRAGGAWMTYHTDKQVRLLVPDMLLKDENMLRVDEKRLTNYLRLSYPAGTEYVEISRYSKFNDPLFDVQKEPVKDAKELQPVCIPEAGRTQQYYVTVCPPKGTKPGIYQGTIQMTADGQDAGTMTVQMYVLPFDLPEAMTYYDTNREFISWLTGRFEGTEKFREAEGKMLQEHSIRHWDWIDLSSEEAFARSLEVAKKYGFSTRVLIGGGHAGTEGNWYKIPLEKRTPEVVKNAVQGKADRIKWATTMVHKYLPDAELFFYGNDEASKYAGLRTNQEPFWIAVLENGGKISGAGGATSFEQAADTQTLMAITTNEQKNADQWHSVGGRLLNYACPFSGPENPYMFRWKSGLYMYKKNYDGWFLLNFLNTRVPWNELAEDPGGDGSYRHFSMCPAIQDGPVPSMAMAGLREALDDIRYATLMKKQAEEAMNSADLEIVREAKRQLAWLHRLNPDESSPEYARQSIIERILILNELIAKRKAGAK